MSSINPKAAAILLRGLCRRVSHGFTDQGRRQRQGFADPERVGPGLRHGPRLRHHLQREHSRVQDPRQVSRLRLRAHASECTRVLQELKGDFIAQVKVTGEFKPGATSTIPGRLSYHGAGLLVVADKDNYISLHRGCVFINDRMRHYANFELRESALSISRMRSRFRIRTPTCGWSGEATKCSMPRALTVSTGRHMNQLKWSCPKRSSSGIVGVSSSDVRSR